MKAQKCCNHRQGKLVPAINHGFPECCEEEYVPENPRISSRQKNTPETIERRNVAVNTMEESSGANGAPCQDKFALAKKLHAENLEHQPLPDKVDDSIFKNFKPRRPCRRVSSNKCTCLGKCEGPFDESTKLNLRFGPVLGCKKPKTRMDLAICWETPVDPIYEPRREAHIDGSVGGLAPAIFTLVQHTPNSSSSASLRIEPAEKKEVELRDCQFRSRTPQDPEDPAGVENGQVENHDKDDLCACSQFQDRCDCLCRDLSRVKITRRDKVEDKFKKRPSYGRCVACSKRDTRDDDPRLIKSAVGLALGLEKKSLPVKTENHQRRNGLAPKGSIPRPRTPFARRSFCIDTLSPPFSVVNGCRDADYPEHWRLMSVYQQSYKNPQKRRNSYRSLLF